MICKRCLIGQLHPISEYSDFNFLYCDVCKRVLATQQLLTGKMGK
jgi:hypothetical protein